MTKNPIAIAIIEFVTLGLGTVILGGPRRTWGLTMFVGAGVLLRYEELRIAPLASGSFNPHWVPMVVGLTLMGAVMAREAFLEAKKLQSETSVAGPSRTTPRAAP